MPVSVIFISLQIGTTLHTHTQQMTTASPPSSFSSEGLRQRQSSFSVTVRQQIAENHAREERFHTNINSMHRKNISYLVSHYYLKVFGFILLLGFALLLCIHPHYFEKLWKQREKMPSRYWMTLYPCVVKSQLPRFVFNFAIATEQNLEARRAVKGAAELRQAATNPWPYQQEIRMHAWEFTDFESQLSSPERMDSFCAPGFAEIYNEAVKHKLLDYQADLVYHCLLKSHTHDGYIKWGVKIEQALTRGLQGVAALAPDGGIDNSILLLPILSVEELKDKDTSRDKITAVPVLALDWLIHEAPPYVFGQKDLSYGEAWRMALWQMTAFEGERWTWWKTACTDNERATFDNQYLRVATRGSCAFYDPTQSPR